ncbi:MAG: sodium:proton antiporter [Promicromonosporaceae bacterium]|nr:sodium:proton antiporter [Promicromonosporaceae bacterium]
MEHLPIVLLGAVAVVIVNMIAPKIGVGAPLLLVVLGVAISFLPTLPDIEIPPEWILVGVLPALLYAAAIRVPITDLSRDFLAISALAIVLVIASAVLLGLVFSALIPGLPLAGGIALGAVLSPTDSVATQITERLGAPPRLTTVLTGEGLFNDASGLVLMRSAVVAVAAAGAMSFGRIAVDFGWAIIGAVVVGTVIGLFGLWVRHAISGAALGTLVSFLMPFVAYLPAEAIGASGLVAVVVTGLVTGYGAARYLRPRDRVFEASNWHTVEIMLEGGIFLLMGLQTRALIDDAIRDRGDVWHGFWLAVLAAAIIVAIRLAFVAPLLAFLERAGSRRRAERRLDWAARRFGAARLRPLVQRGRASLEYRARHPMGVREGVLISWAGMRGVVTLAAAQSLPANFPMRSFVMLIAFGVAVGTLLVQGSTLPLVMRKLGFAGTEDIGPAQRVSTVRIMNDAACSLLDDDGLVQPNGVPYSPAVVARVRADVFRDDQVLADEVIPGEPGRLRGWAQRLRRLLGLREGRFARSALGAVGAAGGSYTEQYQKLRLRVIDQQRAWVLAAADDGDYESRPAQAVLEALDAEQIALEMPFAALPVESG